MTTPLLTKLLLGAGVAMGVIAIAFGTSTTHYAGVPTYSQAGAALGFAIASVLCFLATAIVHRGKPADQPTAVANKPTEEKERAS